MGQDLPRKLGDGSSLQPEAVPLYSQIKSLLLARVIKGEWGPGELLPSEMRLAAEYGVHQGTVRKAIEEMAAQNLVIRQQGKGTFVSGSAMRHNPYHFFRLMPKSGVREAPTNEFILVERAPATEMERSRLQLAGDRAEVVRSVRLRRFNDVPIIVERVAQPAAVFPDLENLYRELSPETTYGLLERRYRVLIVKVTERLTAIAAAAEDAGLLGVEPGAPLLEVSRIARAIDGQIVEWRVSRCQTDSHEYVVDLT